MFWWFERRGAYARCEVLQLSNMSFEIRLVREDGTEIVESFDDARSLANRQEAIERELIEEGWTGPHGWVL